MTQHPDKLFRKGLEHYHKPAPSTAWERIESGLDRKRKRSPWMKIAAGLILLIATSAVIIQLNPTDAIVDTASKESAPVGSPQSAVGSQQSTVDSLTSLDSNPIVERSRINHADVLGEDLPVGERTRAERSRSSRNEPVRNNHQSSVSSPQWAVGSGQSSVLSSERSVDPAKFKEFAAGPQSSVLSPQSAVNSAQSTVNSQQPTTLTQVDSANEIYMVDAAPDVKGTSITYSAEEVNAKFLKKEATPEATPEKKNTSGLQKVIDLAMEFKSEGNVIGELRDKKNELLSFNMPSNKRELNK